MSSRELQDLIIGEAIVGAEIWFAHSLRAQRSPTWILYIFSLKLYKIKVRLFQGLLNYLC